MEQYTALIPQNRAPAGTRQIGIYNAKGNRVGYIPLGNLQPPKTSGKQYSFGAISDVHIVYDTAAEDFRKALTYLNEKEDVAFTCICGDLTEDGTAEQLARYKEAVEAYSPDTPVYAMAGNHEDYANVCRDYLETYTGKPLYYSFTYGNDVFIMCGCYSWENDGIFTPAYLQWLYQTLEANRNRRCFVFEHVMPFGDSGNPGELYPFDMFAGTKGSVFQSLLKHYKNTIFFHGHSHTKFYLQETDETANYSEALGYRSVHIPSLAVPRDISGGNLNDIYADSEGYVVDVYENGVHLRGRDFVRDAFLPIASYWLDTTLQTVEAGTYEDETGTIREEAVITEEPMRVRNTGAVLIEQWNLTPNSSNGQANANYFTFKEIPIEPGVMYYSFGSTRSWFLDSEKNPMKTLNPNSGSNSGSDVKYQFLAPENAYYISIAYNYGTVGTSDDASIQKVV